MSATSLLQKIKQHEATVAVITATSPSAARVAASRFLVN
jgi:hypothetical protein